MRDSLCAAGAAVRVRAAHSTLPRSSAGPIQTQAGFVATAQLPHDVWCAHAHIPRAYDGSSHSPNGSVPIDAISQVPLAWHQKHPSLESPGSRQLSQEAWSAQGILADCDPNSVDTILFFAFSLTLFPTFCPVIREGQFGTATEWRTSHTLHVACASGSRG